LRGTKYSVRGRSIEIVVMMMMMITMGEEVWDIQIQGRGIRINPRQVHTTDGESIVRERQL